MTFINWKFDQLLLNEYICYFNILNILNFNIFFYIWNFYFFKNPLRNFQGQNVFETWMKHAYAMTQYVGSKLMCHQRDLTVLIPIWQDRKLTELSVAKILISSNEFFKKIRNNWFIVIKLSSTPSSGKLIEMHFTNKCIMKATLILNCRNLLFYFLKESIVNFKSILKISDKTIIFCFITWEVNT